MTRKEAIEKVKRVRNLYAYETDYEALDMAIEALSQQKQGEWIYHEDWKNDGECPYECSKCGTAYDYDMNFCGYCGARMHSGEATKVVENCENCKHYITCKESCGGDRWERSE